MTGLSACDRCDGCWSVSASVCGACEACETICIEKAQKHYVFLLSCFSQQMKLQMIIIREHWKWESQLLRFDTNQKYIGTTKSLHSDYSHFQTKQNEIFFFPNSKELGFIFLLVPNYLNQKKSSNTFV